MRRVMRLVIAAMFMLGMAGTAQAQLVRFTANLSGDQETPAPGILTGRVWYCHGHARPGVADRDAGTSMCSTCRAGPTTRTSTSAAPGVAGPTVVNIAFPPNVSNDFNLSGSATESFAGFTLRPDQGIRSWDDFMQSLMGGQMYLNIHSAVNPAVKFADRSFACPEIRSLRFRSGVGAYHSEGPASHVPAASGPFF